MAGKSTSTEDPGATAQAEEFVLLTLALRRQWKALSDRGVLAARDLVAGLPTLAPDVLEEIERRRAKHALEAQECFRFIAERKGASSLASGLRLPYESQFDLIHVIERNGLKLYLALAKALMPGVADPGKVLEDLALIVVRDALARLTHVTGGVWLESSRGVYAFRPARLREAAGLPPSPARWPPAQSRVKRPVDPDEMKIPTKVEGGAEADARVSDIRALCQIASTGRTQEEKAKLTALADKFVADRKPVADFRNELTRLAAAADDIEIKTLPREEYEEDRCEATWQLSYLANCLMDKIEPVRRHLTLKALRKTAREQDVEPGPSAERAKPAEESLSHLKTLGGYASEEAQQATNGVGVDDQNEHARRVAKAKAYMQRRGMGIKGFSDGILKLGRSTYSAWQAGIWDGKGRVKPETRAHIDATIDTLPESD